MLRFIMSFHRKNVSKMFLTTMAAIVSSFIIRSNLIKDNDGKVSKVNDHQQEQEDATICPLSNDLIIEILGYIHRDLRFIITRSGLGDADEVRPSKLSIHAILKARLMDDFKHVLSSHSFRKMMCSLVESDIPEYNDIVKWLKPFGYSYVVYNNESVKTANGYGKYQYNAFLYEGNWKSGNFHGLCKLTSSIGDVYEGTVERHPTISCYYNFQGTVSYVNGDVYMGAMRAMERYSYIIGAMETTMEFQKDGVGKFTHSNEVYEGNWSSDERYRYGKVTYPNGEIYEGNWLSDLRNGRGKVTYPNGDIYESYWTNDYHNKGLPGTLTLARGFLYCESYSSGLKYCKSQSSAQLIFPEKTSVWTLYDRVFKRKFTYCNGDTYEWNARDDIFLVIKTSLLCWLGCGSSLILYICILERRENMRIYKILFPNEYKMLYG